MFLLLIPVSTPPHIIPDFFTLATNIIISRLMKNSTRSQSSNEKLIGGLDKKISGSQVPITHDTLNLYEELGPTMTPKAAQKTQRIANFELEKSQESRREISRRGIIIDFQHRYVCKDMLRSIKKEHWMKSQ